jgi:hypothetical protein
MHTPEVALERELPDRVSETQRHVLVPISAGPGAVAERVAAVAVHRTPGRVAADSLEEAAAPRRLWMGAPVRWGLGQAVRRKPGS